MKRLLSLLVVIAMVVSMIPNVFAAKEEVDMDELTGRLVVLEDISSFEVALEAEADGKIYQWTPDANYNLSLSWTAPEGTEIAVTVAQGEATAVAEGGAVTMDVWAGEVVEIWISEAAAQAAAFTVSGEAWAVPGSDELNGIFLGSTENTVTAEGTTFSGNTTWYNGYFSGTVMTITGAGDYNVIYNGETIAAVDGVVSTAVASSNPRMPVVFAIDTVGEYTINFAYPAGSQMNPAELVIGENAAEIEAGNSQGYFYTWTAGADGTLTITMPSDMGWTYAISNLTTSVSGDIQWSDSDPVANPAEVVVAAGDELQIVVNTYDPTDMWNNPAGTLNITADFEVAVGTESNPVFLGQMENTVIAEGTPFTGNTTWYQGYFSGTVMTITGAGAYNVTYNGETIAAVDGVVSTAVTSANPRMPVVFAIDTVGEYTINFAYPLGNMSNPAELVIGENTASIEAGNSQGYFYTWTAAADGTLTITMPSDMGWTYAISNLTTSVSGDIQWSDSDPVANPAEIEVAAGDELQIIVNTYDPADMWNNPAGDLVITAAFAENVPTLVVTSQPESAIIVAGETVTFTVAAEGEGLTYQWQYSNNGTNWYNTGWTGKNDATLSGKAEVRIHNRQFRCVITDAAGQTVESDPAVLQVLGISEQPDRANGVKHGENAVFHVGFTMPEGATYQWQFKSKTGQNFSNTGAQGNKTDTLYYPARYKQRDDGYIDTNDRYRVRCIITYVLNGEKLTFTTEEGIVMLTGNMPVISEQPTDVTVRSGEVAQISFKTEEALEGAVYQWQYRKSSSSSWHETKMTGWNSETLSVPAIDSRNGYQYRCIVRTPGETDGVANKVITQEATLTVLPAADVTLQPVAATAAVGDSVVFTTAANCDGEAVTYQWQYSNNGTDWYATSASGATTEEVTIVTTAKMNGRYFRCKITNEFGGVTYTDAVQLTVE